MKTTRIYWNPLAGENSGEWEIIEGSDGNVVILEMSYPSQSVVAEGVR